MTCCQVDSASEGPLGSNWPATLSSESQEGCMFVPVRLSSRAQAVQKFIEVHCFVLEPSCIFIGLRDPWTTDDLWPVSSFVFCLSPQRGCRRLSHVETSHTWSGVRESRAYFVIVLSGALTGRPGGHGRKLMEQSQVVTVLNHDLGSFRRKFGRPVLVKGLTKASLGELWV